MIEDMLLAELLFKLYRKGIWGGRHTPIKNLFHIVNSATIKDSKKATKELEKKGLVLVKKSTGEDHISLNPHKKKEIKEYILKILKVDPELLK